MTVIESIAKTNQLTIGATRTAPDNVDVGMGEKVGIFRRADLLAALDAVPVAEANQSIEHELGQRDEAARLSHEYRNRAEKAEAGQRDLLEGNVRLSRDLARVSAELNRTRETYQSELADAEREEREALEKATAIAAERDQWKARAEEAGAIVARVEAVKRKLRPSVEAERLLRRDLNNAINPAFTLPTEAGAVVAYTDHDGSKQLWFRTRDTQRPWIDREGNTWHDAGLARDIAGDFTVLIGADQ